MSICETKTINVSKKWTILAVQVYLHNFENPVFSWNKENAMSLELLVPSEKFFEVVNSDGPCGVMQSLRNSWITKEDVFNYVASELSLSGEMFFEREDLEGMGFETNFSVIDYKVCDCQSEVLFAFDV